MSASPVTHEDIDIITRFFVAGTVLGQPRATPVRRGNFVKMIQAPSGHSIHDWKHAIRVAARTHCRVAAPVDCPLRVDIWAVFRRPKSLQTAKWLGVDLAHTTKPDSDNLAKAVLDAINNSECVWLDDRQVASLHVFKRYVFGARQPGVHVAVSRLSN